VLLECWVWENWVSYSSYLGTGGLFSKVSPKNIKQLKKGKLLMCRGLKSHSNYSGVGGLSRKINPQKATLTWQHDTANVHIAT